jgi:hypothetical protein
MAMVPRGGLPQVSGIKHLSCPTLLTRTIESQGVFPRLSHRAAEGGQTFAECRCRMVSPRTDGEVTSALLLN